MRRLSRWAAVAMLAAWTAPALAGVEQDERRLDLLAQQGRSGEALELASKLDTPFALYLRALLTEVDTIDLRYRGVTSFDPAEARKLIKQALPEITKRSTTEPRFAGVLGRMYDLGLGVQEDPKRAFDWYRYGDSKGDLTSKTRAGLCYLDGSGVAKDAKRGVEMIEAAAKAGDMGAIVTLGEMYRDGDSVPPNTSKAMALFEQAADLGSLDAIDEATKLLFAQLGAALKQQDVASIFRLKDRALRWAKRGADSGNRKSMLILAINLANTAPEESATWAKRAAESGVAAAIQTYAAHLICGVGCEADQVEGEKQLKSALAAAEREGSTSIASEIKAAIGASPADRIRIMGPHAGLTAKVAALPGFGTPLIAIKPQRPKRPNQPLNKPRMGVVVPDLLLLDLTWSPSATGNFIQLSGRVQNVSDQPIERARVTVNYEDVGGKLVATSTGFVQPVTLAPGAIGTFSTFDERRAAMDHVKLDFLAAAGKSVPWVDRSGKDAHQ